MRNSSASSSGKAPGSDTAGVGAALKRRPLTAKPLPKLGSLLFRTSLGGLALAFGMRPESSKGFERRARSGDGARGPKLLPSSSSSSSSASPAAASGPSAG